MYFYTKKSPFIIWPYGFLRNVTRQPRMAGVWAKEHIFCRFFKIINIQNNHQNVFPKFFSKGKYLEEYLSK